jgi:type I restriction enzyme M protein
VGKVPDPKSQVEQITIALIYKFMDDMDAEAEELGGKRKFFTGDFARYGWAKLMYPGLGGHEMLGLYAEGITKMPENPGIPLLFRDIFKNAYLPYRDPETLKSFLKVINEFSYDHSERLGDAFEYLLSVLGSQGDAGQFRTPRHIIDFIVSIVDPKKDEMILDPACGTAGFLISAYKHILRANTDATGKVLLTPDERGHLAENIKGYDISPDMVRLSLANLYLHGFTDPHIYEYDTLTQEDRWNELADVILANPPFMSPKGGIKPHKRFSIDAKRSEVLFVDYMAEHLTANGRAGIIVPEGIIFQSQGTYKDLRKMLVENSLVAVISLPAGCFNPYSGVKTSILILDKSLAKQSDTIGFFKVENDGFGLGAQRRAIERNDLPQVYAEVDAYLHAVRSHKSSNDPQPSLGLIVPKENIKENVDVSLNGERYRDHKVRSANFPTVPIGDVCELFNGRAFKPEEWESAESGGIPIVRIQNLNDQASAFNYFSGEASENNLISAGELLFSWSGSRGTSFGAHIWRGGKAVLNQHIFKVRFDQLRADKMYLFHALNKAVTEVEENLHGGVGLVHITKGNLEKIKIPLPPLEVQEEIVAEIDGYEKVIDGARAVLDYYHPHIPIHPDWPVVPLSDVCETITDGDHLPPPKAAEGVPFVTITNITQDHEIDFTKTFFVPESYYAKLSPSRKPKCGDILYTVTGSYGIPVFVKSNARFCFQRHIALIRTGPRLLNSFLYSLLASPFMLQQGHAAATGVAQKTVSLTALRSFNVPLPSLEIQEGIAAEIEAERILVDANRELITRFEKKIQAALARVWGEEHP